MVPALIGKKIMLFGIRLLTAIWDAHGHTWLFLSSKLLSIVGEIALLVLEEGGIIFLFSLLASSIRKLHSYFSTSTKGRRRSYNTVQCNDNPAFGGRGCGVRHVVRKCKNKGHRATFFNFDSSLGFPGEGWANLRLATWNPRSLTFERFNYCQKLNYDVLVLTELWRGQGRFQTEGHRFTTSSPKLTTKGPRKGLPRSPEDRAAGVGILLYPRMRAK